MYAILPRHRAVLPRCPVGVVSKGVSFYPYPGVRTGVRGRVGREWCVVFRHGTVVSGVPRTGFLQFGFDNLAGVGTRLGRVRTRLRRVWTRLRGVRAWLGRVGTRLSRAWLS